MIESWMHITANMLLVMMGMIFVVGGANTPSRIIGVICVLVAVLSLLANTGVIK